MGNVFFRPWIGKDYATGGIFGKRILVLGESHYGNSTPTADLTKRVLEEYLEYPSTVPSSLRSFKLFEQSLVGTATDQLQRRHIWDSVVFYNFVQNILGDAPRQELDIDNPQQSADAFFEVLEQYRPEYIIAWGYRLWDKAMPAKRWTWGEEIAIEGLPPIKFGYYTLSDGTKVKAIPVRHPSAGYSWNKWHKLINLFLSK